MQTTLYKGAATGAFHDVATGTSTGATHYNAATGYDYVTGIGSPVANLVVQAATDGTVAAPASDHLVISGAPTTDVAGASYSFTVTAQNASNATDAGYTGTIRFSSTDVQAGLPATYTFAAGDAGSHTFTATLKTAAAQTITATDTTTTAGSVTTPSIAVSPAAASQFVLSGLSTTATVGQGLTVTVTAKDPYGNVATGYTGTVSFASSDSSATLPGRYTFTTQDAGKHTFGVTFATAGSESVTVSDAAATTLSAIQSGISVVPAAPLSLAASVLSTTGITLSWTGAAGATGYTIQRSTVSTGGWATIGTTAAGTITYTDSGLSSGTTYYYRVQANGGAGSAFSNTASATTTAALPPGGDSLWSNAFTPSENTYSYGSYDVGEKFESSVAGMVTGARFYKQTWMAGFTHVGYLWSSTGQLLASATFTGESSFGWQQVSFSSPVSIAANTVYIVSFSSGGGYFGITSGYFSAAGYTNGPLQALSNGVAGGNGVYQTSSGGFPSINGVGMNFWADVVFSPTSTPSVVPHSSVAGLTIPTGGA